MSVMGGAGGPAPSSTLNSLPPQVLGEIFHFLTAKELVGFDRVNRAARSGIDEFAESLGDNKRDLFAWLEACLLDSRNAHLEIHQLLVAKLDPDWVLTHSKTSKAVLGLYFREDELEVRRKLVRDDFLLQLGASRNQAIMKPLFHMAKQEVRVDDVKPRALVSLASYKYPEWYVRDLIFRIDVDLGMVMRATQIPVSNWIDGSEHVQMRQERDSHNRLRTFMRLPEFEMRCLIDEMDNVLLPDEMQKLMFVNQFHIAGYNQETCDLFASKLDVHKPSCCERFWAQCCFLD